PRGRVPMECLAPRRTLLAPRDRAAPRRLRRARAGGRDLRQLAAAGARGGGVAGRLGELRRGMDFAEAAGRVDRRAEVETLVFRLLDEHDRLERVDVVDALLLALRRNLGLVRPVVELHLRDPGDLADLAEVELDLVQVLGEVDRL